MPKLSRSVTSKFGLGKTKDGPTEAAIKMSLAETAMRAALTASVTFAVGWILKRTFEKTVEEAAPQAPKIKPSMGSSSAPAGYRSPARKSPVD